MSRAFQFGAAAWLQLAFTPGLGSPPLPLKRIVSGTHAPGRPPIARRVHASIAGRSLLYMSKMGMFS
jgi:hypothetical protein